MTIIGHPSCYNSETKYIEISRTKIEQNNSLYNNIYKPIHSKTCNYICEYLECHLFLNMHNHNKKKLIHVYIYR
jgi:hypothetical protein